MEGRTSGIVPDARFFFALFSESGEQAAFLCLMASKNE